MGEKTIKSGLWGGPLGAIILAPKTGSVKASTVLKQIKINYDQHAIRSFKVFYENAEGLLGSYGTYRSNNDPKSTEKWIGVKVCFRTGEILTGIEGTYDMAEDYLVVTSLTFKTNKAQSKTVGHVRGAKFSFETFDGKIVGFHGRTGAYVDAIGIYLASIN